MKRKNIFVRTLLSSLLILIHFFGLLYIFFPSLHAWGRIDIWGTGLIKISLYLFLIIFSFSFFVFFKNKPIPQKYFKSFVQSGIFISIIAILTSYLLIGIEGQRYPNYLYSIIHLDKRSLPEYLNLQYFLIGIFLMGILNLENLRKKPLFLHRQLWFGDNMPKVLLWVRKAIRGPINYEDPMANCLFL